MPVCIGVLGLGSVFEKYGRLLEELVRGGRVSVTAVYDPDTSKRDREAARFDVRDVDNSPESLIAREDVDAVLVLTSMNEHGSLATAAYAAGKHVLVEKPMATSLPEAKQLLALSQSSDPTAGLCTAHPPLAHLQGDEPTAARRGGRPS